MFKKSFYLTFIKHLRQELWFFGTRDIKKHFRAVQNLFKVEFYGIDFSIDLKFTHFFILEAVEKIIPEALRRKTIRRIFTDQFEYMSEFGQIDSNSPVEGSLPTAGDVSTTRNMT